MTKNKYFNFLNKSKKGFPYIIDPERPPRVFTSEKSFLIHGATNPSITKKKVSVQLIVSRFISFSGDTILLDVKLNNNSGKKIQALRIKLKQIWFYGSRMEKVEIFRLTHKDKSFPLSNEFWSNQIPIKVPNVDFHPTVTNAALVFVCYFIIFKAIVNFGGDLVMKIPITMASHPPLFKNQIQDSENKLNNGNLELEKHFPFLD